MSQIHRPDLVLPQSAARSPRPLSQYYQNQPPVVQEEVPIISTASTSQVQSPSPGWFSLQSECTGSAGQEPPNIAWMQQQCERIRQLHVSNALCDITLQCGAAHIAAHRVVLAAASDYFQAMFTGVMNEAVANTVEIQGIEPDALKALIDYCYSGRLEVGESSVESLLSGACLLQLSDVVHECSQFLAQQLHASNCLGIRAFAESQAPDLYKEAQQYTLRHFMDVRTHHEFLLLSTEEVAALLSDDRLCVQSEADAYSALVAWLQHDLTTRATHAATLLALIRLSLLEKEYLVDIVERSSLFKDDVNCQDLIVRALKFHLLPDRRPDLGERCRPRRSTVGMLYAVGGHDGTGKGAMTIEQYDFLDDCWRIVGQMASRRLQIGVAVMQNQIHVVGGRDGLKTLPTFEAWSPNTSAWTQKEPLNTPRHGLGVACLEGPLYAVGGHDGWSYLSSVERYDPAVNKWTYVAEMSVPRSTLGVAVLNGRLYAIGGRDGSQCLRTVERFDPHTDRWTACAPMVKRRGGVGVAALDGCIYAVGGVDCPTSAAAQGSNAASSSTRYDCVERYDPKLDQWSVIAQISFGRDGIGLCPFGSYLFAVGGFNGQQYLKTVEYYDPHNNEWSSAANLCAGRVASCVVVLPRSRIQAAELE